MDIYCRDVLVGEVRLFEGEAGNYVLLGIQAAQLGFKGGPFVAGTQGGTVPGLCVALTEQPNRRLVHLVNCRSDGPIPDVKVSVRLPAGRRAKSVALASPESEHAIVMPHQQQSETLLAGSIRSARRSGRTMQSVVPDTSHTSLGPKSYA